MLAEHTTPAEPRDRDRQLLEVEVFAVAVSVSGERRVEVHVGDPEAADELIDGRPPQDTLVGQAEAREIRVRVQGSGLELLSVVDDGFAGCAIAAQEFVESAGANRVVLREVKGRTCLDRLSETCIPSPLRRRCVPGAPPALPLAVGNSPTWSRPTGAPTRLSRLNSHRSNAGGVWAHPYTGIIRIAERTTKNVHPFVMLASWT